MKMKKWLPALLISGLSVANIACKKCEGDGPKFTPEEKSMLTNYQASDSLVFRSNAGNKRILYVFKREFYEPKDGDKFDPPVKGSVKCAVDDNATASLHFASIKSTTVSDELFVVSLQKNIISTDLIFSGSMMRNTAQVRSLAPNLDSLQVNGTTYYNVIALEPDQNSAWPGTGPATLKLYYVPEKGLIRFDNAGNETWERVN